MANTYTAVVIRLIYNSLGIVPTSVAATVKIPELLSIYDALYIVIRRGVNVGKLYPTNPI